MGRWQNGFLMEENERVLKKKRHCWNFLGCSWVLRFSFFLSFFLLLVRFKEYAVFSGTLMEWSSRERKRERWSSEKKKSMTYLYQIHFSFIHHCLCLHFSLCFSFFFSFWQKKGKRTCLVLTHWQLLLSKEFFFPFISLFFLFFSFVIYVIFHNFTKYSSNACSYLKIQNTIHASKTLLHAPC